MGDRHEKVTLTNATVEAIVFECLGGQTIDEAVIGEGQVITGRTVVAKIGNAGRIKPNFASIQEGGGL